MQRRSFLVRARPLLGSYVRPDVGPFVTRARSFASLLAIALAPVLVACGAAKGARPPTTRLERTTAPSSQVTDAGFASAVHDLLLSEPKTPERAERLAGVEARLMARAAIKFKARSMESALNGVRGGLYLIRTGELDPNTLGDAASDALKASAHELSSRGDEGRARAMYEILARTAKPADRTDASEHLDAIRAWTRDAIGHGGPLESAGALEKVAVRRRLLEPSDAALQDATSVTNEWIRRALVLLQQFQQGPHAPLAREEAMEAHRALGAGGAVLAALYLRDADASGALTAIDRAGAKDMIPPDLLHSIEVVAEGPDPLHWLDVVRALRPLTGHGPAPGGPDGEDDFLEDRELYRAASFGIALEAYRLDPSVPESAAIVATGLQDLGMGEASPAILVEAVNAHKDVRTLGAMLGITIGAMQVALQENDVEQMRRTFRAAAPIIALGDANAAGGKVHPTSARVRGLMGEVELNDGRIDDARALLKASVAGEKSGRVLLTLAKIEWRDGTTSTAIDHLRDALSAEDSIAEPALRGEILLTVSDITREKVSADAARSPLTEALRALVSSKTYQRPEERARIERTLARVLDRFGADKPALRALERAYAAGAGDKNQASLTIGQIVGRAFVRGELPAARDGLQRAIDADLDADDMVYLALWVRLLERQLRAHQESATDRVFSRVVDDGRWTAKLAAFGLGKLRPEDLVAAAKSASQRTEAMFYAAMDRRASGDTQGAMDGLRQVIAGGTVQLMEVSFARDLLDGAHAQVGGPLPPDVALP